MDADTNIGFATIQTQTDKAYPEEGTVHQISGSGVWQLHGKHNNLPGIWVVSLDRDKIRVADILFALKVLSHFTHTDYRLLFEWEQINRFDATER